LRNSMTTSGSTSLDMLVKPTMSANSTVTCMRAQQQSHQLKDLAYTAAFWLGRLKKQKTCIPKQCRCILC
jgi:hypothetical protein